MEDENDVEDIENTSEEADLNTADESSEDESQSDDSYESIVDTVPKTEFEKAMELAENQKIRAEKAERALKASKEAPAKTAESKELSTTDLYALMAEKVPQEDISEVVEYATLKKISVADALKSTVVKAILSENAEKRTVAEATNVSTTKRGSGKISDETLLANASKGNLPDNDDDLRRLIRLRKGIK